MPLASSLRESWRRLGWPDVLVAVSGGGDSTALLGLLIEALSEPDPPTPPPRLVVAHLDHGLRAGSEADAARVRELALGAGLEHRSRRLSVDEVAAIRCDPRGIQAAAREIRRRQLEAWAGEVGTGKIAYGHTRDDLAETMLLALLRGGGSGALAGMRATGPGRAWRPLLGVARQELREYLRAHATPFLEDPSNACPDFDRVRVRTEVLPVLEDIRPGAARVLARVANLLGADSEALDGMARDWLAQHSVTPPEGGLELPSEPLAGLAEAVGTRVVRQALEAVTGWRGDFRTVAAIRDLAGRPEEAPRLDLPRGLRVDGGPWIRIRSRGSHGGGAGQGMVAEADGGQGIEIRLDALAIGGEAVVLEVGSRRLQVRLASERPEEVGLERLWIPASCLIPPVRLRSPRAGDRFRPISLGGGSKRLARYLRDRGRDRAARQRVLVVEDAEGIAGVLGCEARFPGPCEAGRVLVIEPPPVPSEPPG